MATAMKSKKNIFLGLVCIVVFVIIFLVGLWPFSFSPVNEVSGLPDGEGLSFDGTGLAYSEGSLDLASLLGNGSLSIELWLEPNTDANWYTDHWHYAQILSLYDLERRSDLLLMGQWAAGLELRSRRPGQETYSKRGFNNLLEMGSAPFITVTSDKERTSLYVDGELTKVYKGFSLADMDGVTGAKLILGNSPTGKRPWTGKLYKLAVYDRSLTADEVARNYRMRSEVNSPARLVSGGAVISYRLGDLSDRLVRNSAGDSHGLLVPTTLRPLKRVVLTVPSRIFSLNKRYVKDVVINVAGFVPLGFLVAAFLYASTGLSGYSRYVITLLVGVGSSLAIELVQPYLLTRSSSLMDLLTNTIGTMLGVVMLKLAIRWMAD